MISAEVSVYPFKTNDASTTINNSIQSLNRYQLEYSVGSISTYLQGSEDEVWNGLREMFQQACQAGEVSMVITLTNAASGQ
ncbi:MAG TPA: YkoF family thiamine/hydroxymethylpyrimidine-binding protein [Bacillota bacterium]|jgi:uncharacterized protein YqgV (UPF0045/DUF77 family)|nr:hypothetical protein [Bacillota bacterium]HOB87653.1 YkoF family thiamine/hydroxymethylpyrimidine-binding protein [Bacillota bacterium]HOP69358.1 YkoF family thiamine/hydroxymethylpyrimidine-binding protein [Bacillota bacterium]HPT33701.1 YkoF family thiamine/hydroxymethylpyrimidine-binding protein [Bacillota bacterium]HPZ64823.1 YkoF family thiamine/hydroxymethylpyrimidine-binding protein [Bacillota bacterium]